MEDNLGQSPETMRENSGTAPERTNPETMRENSGTAPTRTEPETTKNTPENSSETTKNSPENSSETTKNSPENSSEKTNYTRNSPQISNKSPEKTKTERTTSETTRNSPENIPETTTKNSPETTTKNSPETTSNNFSEIIKNTNPDEDVDPFKLFNIPKQNVYVPPEIVPPAVEAAIRHLKPPEPIVLTEIVEPETEKLNQIEQQMQELQEERRKFEEERRKFEEERRRSFIGRKSPRIIYGSSSTPSPDSTQSPRFAAKGRIGRKSPGNKRPVFVISDSSSSSSSSSSSENEDEIETTTPKTTIKISSSTSEEEELSNSLKEIKIKSNEQMYKEEQEKRMAKMEATMQLILEKLDKKERKGIYEEDKELVEEARTKKEIVQQVKEGGDQEKLEEIAQKTIP